MGTMQSASHFSLQRAGVTKLAVTLVTTSAASYPRLHYDHRKITHVMIDCYPRPGTPFQRLFFPLRSTALEKQQHEYIVSSLHYIRAKHQVVNRSINGEIWVLLTETSSARSAILTWVTEVTHVRYPTVHVWHLESLAKSNHLAFTSFILITCTNDVD